MATVEITSIDAVLAPEQQQNHECEADGPDDNLHVTHDVKNVEDEGHETDYRTEHVDHGADIMKDEARDPHIDLVNGLHPATASGWAPPSAAVKPDSSARHPQARMAKFWHNFKPDYEGGIYQILPDSLARIPLKLNTKTSEPVNTSYEQARDLCIKRVQRIVRECQSLNEKYTDVHFDLEDDLKIKEHNNYLYGLEHNAEMRNLHLPKDVRRVTDVFDHPEFYKDGASFDDVLQGNTGDCWMLAALSTLTANEALLRKVCVIQNQDVGVYGFVFYRDGQFQPSIIDDKLYLRAPAYDESHRNIVNMYGVRQKDDEDNYTHMFQRGSKALYFAACRDQDETWVALLEKAYAKAHGDYQSLQGGQTGEALEDMTGGVTTEIFTSSILSKDRFWKDLSRSGKEFLFSASAANYWNWQGNNGSVVIDKEELRRHRRGLISHHSYAIIDTYEGHGVRLVKMRNPWGEAEWTGPWSDGSKEWTAEWMQRLGHNFGEDGVFWMPYAAMLAKYRYMDRTRIFGPEWFVAQQWLGVQVPWDTRTYLPTKFSIKVTRSTDAVIALSQLDRRYYRGFQGRYSFSLSFVVCKDGDDEEDFLARSRKNYSLVRGANVEVRLEPGSYTVLFKVIAYDVDGPDIETVVRENYYQRKEKVTQMATLYDLAHARAAPPADTPLKVLKQQRHDTGSTRSTARRVAPRVREETVPDTPITPIDAPPHLEGERDYEYEHELDRNREHEHEHEHEHERGGTGDNDHNDDDERRYMPSRGSSPIRGDRPFNFPPRNDRASMTSIRTIPGDRESRSDAWNAYCVVGIKAYSKLDDLELKIVPPGSVPDETVTTLDRDDIAKAAQDEVNAEEKVNAETLAHDDAGALAFDGLRSPEI